MTAQVTTLYDFGALGSGQPTIPHSGPMQASDGNFYGASAFGGANNNNPGVGTFGHGTVYRVTPAGTASVLYSFGSTTTDGRQPESTLVEADGFLFGTTFVGGAADNGTIFRISLAGSYVSLHSFGAIANDGVAPSALVRAADGALYGLTAGGGEHGRGTAFRISTLGDYAVLHSFGSAASDGAAPRDLILGRDDNFYGVTAFGGSSGRGTLFRMTPAGAVTVLRSFGGCGGGAALPSGIAQGPDDNFYGISSEGGVGENGTVFVVTPGGIEAVLHRFAAVANGRPLPTGKPLIGPGGNLFGLTQYGGTNDVTRGGDGTLFMVTPTGTFTEVHSFSSARISSDAPSFALIQAVDGALYGVTQAGGANDTGRIFKAVIAGAGTATYPATVLASACTTPRTMDDSGGALTPAAWAGLLLFGLLRCTRRAGR